MTTATRSVAVVATRLPDMDRRALSVAWFSALHLAQPCGGGAAPPHAATCVAPPRSGAPKTTAPAGTAPAATAYRASAGGVPTTARGQAPELLERRSAGSDLARRIERAIVRHVPRATQRSATIAIDAGDGRVQLLVRTDRTATRIVALCSPLLRERVDRALAHARFVLAAGGTRLEVAG
jgi:hypothetical protein